MSPENRYAADLLDRAGRGEREALGAVFAQHRDRLARMVEVRLDHRLRGRLDASDVLQEAYLEFARSLADYLRDPAVPLYLWLRCITGRKLQTLHRRHLGAKLRTASREVSLALSAVPQASSESLAAHLLGRLTTPSQAAMREELRKRVQDALSDLEPIDREVLVLRHFEQLTNTETAQVLGLGESAASNRYVRSLKRLKEILLSTPEFLEARADVPEGRKQ